MDNNHLSINSIFDSFIRDLSEKRAARYYIFQGHDNKEYAISRADNADFNFMDKIRMLFYPGFVDKAIYSLIDDDKISNKSSGYREIEDPQTALQSYWQSMLSGNVFYSNKNQTIYIEKLLETIKLDDKDKTKEVFELNKEYLKKVLINSVFNEYVLDEMPKKNKRYLLDEELKKKESDVEDGIYKDLYLSWKNKREEYLRSYLTELKNTLLTNKYFYRETTDLSIDISHVFSSDYRERSDDYYKDILGKVAELANILIFNSILNMKDIDVVSSKLMYRTELYDYVSKSEIYTKDYRFCFSYVKDKKVNHLENSRRFNPDYQKENLKHLSDFLFKEERCIYCLYGNAGIGKTELVLYFLNNNIGKDGQIAINNALINYVIKLDCKSENNSEHMLKDMIADLYLSDNHSENREQAFEDNLKILKNHYGNRLLLVIDNYKNFNYFQSDFGCGSEIFKKLISAGIHILAVSNVDLRKTKNRQIHCLNIENIDSEDLLDLFCKTIRINRNQKNIKKMIENDLLNNTYSVVMVSNLIKASLKDVEESRKLSLISEIMDSIKDEDKANEYTRQKVEKQRDIYEQFVHILLNYESVLMEGRRWYVLMNAAVIPEGGIEKNIFLEMISKELSCNRDLEELIELGFIRTKKIGNIEHITIHQLLRNAVISIIRKNNRVVNKQTNENKKGGLLKWNSDTFGSMIDYMVVNKNTYHYDSNSEIMRIMSLNIYEAIISFFVKKNKDGHYVTRTVNPSMNDVKMVYLVIAYDAMVDNDSITKEHAYIAALLVNKILNRDIRKEDTFIFSKICNEVSVDLFNSVHPRNEEIVRYCSEISAKGMTRLESYKSNSKTFNKKEYLRRKGYDLECLLEGNYYTFSNLSPIEKIEGYIGVQKKRKEYIDQNLISEMSYINGMYVVSNKYITKYDEDVLAGKENIEDLKNSFIYANKFIDEVEDEKYDDVNMYITARNHFLDITSRVFSDEKIVEDMDNFLASCNLTIEKLTNRIVRNMLICLDYYRNILVRIDDVQNTFRYIDSVFTVGMLKDNMKEDDIRQIEALQKLLKKHSKKK